MSEAKARVAQAKLAAFDAAYTAEMDEYLAAAGAAAAAISASSEAIRAGRGRSSQEDAVAASLAAANTAMVAAERLKENLSRSQATRKVLAEEFAEARAAAAATSCCLL